jgi:hypothetical protein
MSATFNRQHLKKTVRRSATDGRVYIYPHRLGNTPAARTREIRAQLSIAIRYFETMVGRRRSAFDPEALVSLFGEPKLARGLVTALARYYRYRPLQPEDIVPAATAAALRERGLGGPVALRAALFTRANTPPRAGFVPEGDRGDALSTFGAELGLDPEQLSDLLWLDSEENWALTRLATPDPADLISLYDYLALETVLRYASKLDVAFRPGLPDAVADDLRLLLGYYGLLCDMEPPRAGVAWRVTVHGRADARGSWARHGRRLARVLVRLLAAHPGCLEGGEAQIELNAASTVLRIDGPLLAQLGDGPPATDPAAPALTPAACADLRAAGLPSGWALRMDPEPLVYAGGVVAPLTLCSRRGRRVYLLSAPGASALERLERALPHLRSQGDFLLLVPESLAAGRDLPAPALTYDPSAAPDLRALVALLEAQFTQDPARPVVAQEASAVTRLLGRVRRDGVVGVDQVREALGDLPPAGPLPGGRGAEFIADVGLCSAGFLARVRELIDEQLEYFAGRLVTLPQLTATIALNLPGADAVGVAALEKLVAALPEYVIVPRKLFDPYVRAIGHVTGSAGVAAAAASALGRAA